MSTAELAANLHVMATMPQLPVVKAMLFEAAERLDSGDAAHEKIKAALIQLEGINAKKLLTWTLDQLKHEN